MPRGPGRASAIPVTRPRPTMNPHPEIEALTRRVASRHNAFLRRRTLIVAVLAAATLTIAGALCYLPRGHSVPALIPLAIAALAAASAAAWFLLKRMTPAAAILEADRFFGLKDGLASATHLATHAPHAPATALQWHWLSSRLPACDPATITRPFPKKSAATAAVLAATAITLCLLPASPSIRAAEQLAEQTRQRVAESKEELEKLIEQLEKDIVAPDDKEQLDMDEFRKMVKQIDETGDRTEAARQFARIERKVRDALRNLDQQRDEETLKLAAKELRKSEDTDARKLGKKLDAKELTEAAELLEKLAARKIDPKDLEKNAKQRKQTLDEAKKDLAKMRAASKRLAAAGKQRQAANQAAGGGAGANANGHAGGEGAAGGGEGKPLEDMLAELDDAAAELEKDLEEIEFDPDTEWDDEAGDAMFRIKSKLGKHLRKMHGKRLAKSKLDALRAALAQAQGFTQGQTQQLGLGQGGNKPGTGSSWSERKQRDDSQNNGALAELKGQHGDGPSLSSVEDAESGTGISTRRGSAQQRDFTRQLESFVQRDDVPEALKLGVRNYFQNLQSATPAE